MTLKPTSLAVLGSAVAALGLALSTPGFAAEPLRQDIAAPPPTGNSPAAPFSEGVMVGGSFYVAGHVGIDPESHQVPADVDIEAHVVLDAVKQTLTQAGLSMDDLVSVTVYCTDLTLYDHFNAIYRGYFKRYPARAFIGVNQLVRGAHFEIAGIAVKSRASK
jgi:2-iminobutanoate/2-iminopropanoate deaminase